MKNGEIAARSALQQLRVHLLDQRQAADAGADDHAEAVAVARRAVEVRVLHRHVRRGDRVVNEGVGLLDFLLLDPVLGVEAVHLAGDRQA